MGLSKGIVNKFKTSFENRCYQLIIGAYNSALTKNTIKLDWDENDITAELHNYINDNPMRIKYKISTNVEQHLPKNNTNKRKGFAAKFPRIDLRMNTFSSSCEYKYYFEAKNLKENGYALKRRYINTGINSFLSKKYENGSLVGYLIKGNLDLSIDGINSLLRKDKRNTEVLKPKFFKFHNNYYESEHKEIGILKHLFFDFTNNL